ncbi:MAG: ATP-dependent DNA helicase [Gammaproteobacteria bacterium]
MDDPSEILGPDGPLAASVPDFAPRPQQREMAEAVAAAIDSHGTLIAEAGTGTGKTFAYLVPALLSGHKVLISTGTRTLQDQLFHRDLPVIRNALQRPVHAALLKGRANYLCLHRLDIALMEGRLRSRQLVSDLEEVRHWSARTGSGDIAEVTAVTENSAIWPLVTSTTDNCLGQECPAYGDCHVVKARREAQEADVVVINHHLLFADMALKEEGFGELLPGANAFVLDEAHQLPEVASNFFGVSLTGRQLTELARDTLAEHLREAGDMQDLGRTRDELEGAVADFRLALGRQPQRLAWAALRGRPQVADAVERLQRALGGLHDWLELAAPRSKGLDACWRRSGELLQRLATVTDAAEDDYIQWVDIHRKSFALHLTPLEVAPAFQARMQERRCAWVFTSATLAVGDSFAHFAQRLGIEDAQTRLLDSPFDYGRNALLYLPERMPDPTHPGFTDAVVDAAVPVIEASRGRAFVLFTSHRALQAAAQRLAGRLDYPLLVQGDAPRGELLERFRRLGNAVLLGTGSFWEGVDVRGPALSCVIIDKLPFASPGDPVLQARIDRIRRSGGNPFMDFQLPNAVIALKQGAGRLIRDVNDRGVMMLCDPRLLSKPYGRVFLRSLPPMARTRRLAEAQDFLRAPAPAADALPS